MSITQLSRQIGLSPTRTVERLRRLTSGGGRYKPFLEFVQSAEYVQEWRHLTGGDLFLLKVAAVLIEKIERIIEMLLPFVDPTKHRALLSR